MTPHEFVAKWGKVKALPERATCQTHFNDLCAVVGEPDPILADPTGDWFTFEKGVTTTEGRQGYADVWRKGCFGWEYKKSRADLGAAYQQLLRYREALYNPPLLVVCDHDRFEIHTNFPNTAKKVHSFDMVGLIEPKNLDRLRAAFTEPDQLNPGLTQEQVTEEIAGRFAELTHRLGSRGVAGPQPTRFLLKIMFCMFAQDIGALRHGLFTEVLVKGHPSPATVTKRLRNLFDCMARGEPYGTEDIFWFNGGLFADADVLELDAGDVAELVECAKYNWAQVEPSIFGTLFERTLDPGKRAQLGAHYTHRRDIEVILRAVLDAPLRREWAVAKARADALWEKLRNTNRRLGGRKDRRPAKDARSAFNDCVESFLKRLTKVTIFDPACGSGNFLYLALHMLLDLEKEVWLYASEHDLPHIPRVDPTQLRGWDTNAYAHQLAQVAIWIGFIQWNKFNGFRGPTNPVLNPMDSIKQADSILGEEPSSPRTEPDWPDAEFIVGNPPFLGNKQMRSVLGDEYVQSLWRLYGSRIPAMSDLSCYWFEKARALIEVGRTKRAGLLSTTGIKQVGGRRVLERIRDTGHIFFAVSDREWENAGAAVRIVMVGFEGKDGAGAILDGKPVAEIHPDLTSGVNTSAAGRQADNLNLCFMGTTKVGSFDITYPEARKMLDDPNPHGRPNSDVLRPWVNGSDLVQVSSNRWIIDFGVITPKESATLYALPFSHLSQHVRGERQGNGRETYRLKWWIHGEPRPAFRSAVSGLSRYIGTARVAKHRLFVWLDTVILPDSKVIAIAFDDDFHFGVLQSRVHQIWTLAQCGRHGVGSDATYNPSTCFLTFPFPEPFAAHEESIGFAAKELDRRRNNWLNPPEWSTTETLIFPGSVDGPWKQYVHDADPDTNIGTVRYPRTVPKNADCATKLRKRTLTSLYNESPAWLRAAHRKLDELVFAAYGWSPDLSNDDLLAKLLALNLDRAAEEAGNKEATPTSVKAVTRSQRKHVVR